MKRICMGLAAGLVLLCGSQAGAVPVTMVDQGASWNYTTLGFDAWPVWGSIDYSSVNWNSPGWLVGNAAFGNTWTYNTYWAANTDLGLQTTYNLSGSISNVFLQVAVDNGFAVFINGQLAVQANAEGFTNYWEYIIPIANNYFVQGLNTISVIVEDHGGGTFFDLRLIADVNPQVPAPEPSTFVLVGGAVAGAAFIRRFRRRGK